MTRDTREKHLRATDLEMELKLWKSKNLQKWKKWPSCWQVGCDNYCRPVLLPEVVIVVHWLLRDRLVLSQLQVWQLRFSCWGSFETIHVSEQRYRRRERDSLHRHNLGRRRESPLTSPVDRRVGRDGSASSGHVMLYITINPEVEIDAFRQSNEGGGRYRALVGGECSTTVSGGARWLTVLGCRRNQAQAGGFNIKHRQWLELAIYNVTSSFFLANNH